MVYYSVALQRANLPTQDRLWWDNDPKYFHQRHWIAGVKAAVSNKYLFMYFLISYLIRQEVSVADFRRAFVAVNPNRISWLRCQISLWGRISFCHSTEGVWLKQLATRHWDIAEHWMGQMNRPSNGVSQVYVQLQCANLQHAVHYRTNLKPANVVHKKLLTPYLYL